MADISDIIANSIEGNALEVQNTVDQLMQQKVADAIAQLRGDISSSVFGSYASDDIEVEQEFEQESEFEQEQEEPELDNSYNDSSLEDLLQGLEDTNG